jgi:hypothetical protein
MFWATLSLKYFTELLPFRQLKTAALPGDHCLDEELCLALVQIAVQKY